MKITQKQRNKLNAIARKYCRWANPNEIRAFWDEVNAIVDPIILVHRQDYPELGSWCCVENYSIGGDCVENSNLVFSVYEGCDGVRNEYNIYFS